MATTDDSAGDADHAYGGSTPAAAVTDRGAGQTRSASGALDALVASSPVAQLLVGADGRLALVNVSAEHLLGLSATDVGRPLTELDLDPRLGDAVAAAVTSTSGTTLRNVSGRAEPLDGTTAVDMRLTPLLGNDTGGLLGVSVTCVPAARDARANTADRRPAQPDLLSTEKTSRTLRDELQSTLEELARTNEELQSTNEELETTSEELELAGEALRLLGEQLDDRSSALARLTLLAQTVLDHLGPAVVVDRDLVVRMWSGEAEELLGVPRHSAMGRPLLDLESKLPAGALRDVLVTGPTLAEGTVRHAHLNAADVPRLLCAVWVSVIPLRTDDAGQTLGSLVLFETRPVDHIQPPS